MASGAYIQVEGTDKAKLELGDDPDRTGSYTMDFQVVNYSDADKTYRLDTTVLGQTAQGGQFKHGKVTYLVSDYARSWTPPSPPAPPMEPSPFRPTPPRRFL